MPINGLLSPTSTAWSGHWADLLTKRFEHPPPDDHSVTTSRRSDSQMIRPIGQRPRTVARVGIHRLRGEARQPAREQRGLSGARSRGWRAGSVSATASRCRGSQVDPVPTRPSACAPDERVILDGVERDTVRLGWLGLRSRLHRRSPSWPHALRSTSLPPCSVTLPLFLATSGVIRASWPAIRLSAQYGPGGTKTSPWAVISHRPGALAWYTPPDSNREPID